MSPEWSKGFDDGYKFATDHFNTNIGRYDAPLPETFVHRGTTHDCGFGEGLISGQLDKIEKAFGRNYISVTWKDGQAIITR
jgi:hypothetical protein